MEDPKWLRLVTVGLILAALAIGYFLLTGGLVKNNKTNRQTQVAVSSPSPIPTITPLPLTVPATPSAVNNQNPNSAYNRIAERAQGGIQTLPATGFPVGLILISATSAVAVGLGLRKYPH